MEAMARRRASPFVRGRDPSRLLSMITGRGDAFFDDPARLLQYVVQAVCCPRAGRIWSDEAIWEEIRRGGRARALRDLAGSSCLAFLPEVSESYSPLPPMTGRRAPAAGDAHAPGGVNEN